MEVLAVSFFFLFSLSFIILALIYRSISLYFIAGTALILWGYMLLTYGITETTISSKSNIQNLTYSGTQIIGINTTEELTHVTSSKTYSDAYGWYAVFIGLLFAIAPALNSYSGGKIRIA